MRTSLLRAVGALLAALSLLGLSVGIASAAETGPDTAACATAGAAVAKAQSLLDAKEAADLASTVDSDAKVALVAAQASAKTLDATLDVTSATAVAAAIASLETVVADPATPQGALEVAKKQLAADRVLQSAMARATDAASKLVAANAAFDTAGGAAALADLGEAGGVSKLLDAQAIACAGIVVTTPPATPTPTAAPTTTPAPSGSFTQVRRVPSGSAATGTE